VDNTILELLPARQHEDLGSDNLTVAEACDRLVGVTESATLQLRAHVPDSQVLAQNMTRALNGFMGRWRGPALLPTLPRLPVLQLPTCGPRWGSQTARNSRPPPPLGPRLRPVLAPI
jgi:hypothetical protein